MGQGWVKDESRMGQGWVKDGSRRVKEGQGVLRGLKRFEEVKEVERG